MSVPTGADAGFYLPAEWAPHRACWLAWPWDDALWGAELAGAQASFLDLCEAISWCPDRDAGCPAEALEILVPDAEEGRRLGRALDTRGLTARIHPLTYGDGWMRDMGPLMGWGTGGHLAARCFRFNGWGGRYVFEGDAEVAEAVAGLAQAEIYAEDAVVEGGAIDVDGEGTCLTTRACLLNPNRHPRASEAGLTRLLTAALGVSKVIWLDRGLRGDHTDGHVDNLARFVAPGRVLCMASSGPGDPNDEVLTDAAARLRIQRDARGRSLQVLTTPSPGAVPGADGSPLPASYLNFYVANHAVAVPTYGVPADGQAIDTLASLFPNRRVVGIPCGSLLKGGGALHCVTCPEPSRPEGMS